jgi:hypothetical protein
MPFKNRTAEWIDLALKRDGEASALETDVETADPAKKRCEGRFHSTLSNYWASLNPNGKSS